MSFRELILLAWALGAQGGEVIEERTLTDEVSQEYWLASKLRIERWNRLLRSFDDGSEAKGETHNSNPKDGHVSGHTRVATQRHSSPQSLRALEIVLQEIIAGELLARVWAALSAAYEQTAGPSCAQTLAQSVLAGQLQSSARALCLLQTSSRFLGQGSHALIEFHRWIQSWADLVVARVCLCGKVAHYAANPSRAEEFATEWAAHRSDPLRDELLTAILKGRWQKHQRVFTPNADLNLRIARAVTAALPQGSLAELGEAVLWCLWLESFTTKHEKLIDSCIC